MSEKVPVYDNHIHMSPSGRNVDALREFQAAGGTGLTLVTLPYKEVQISKGEDFATSYEITYNLAEKARECTDLEINIAVGPYPVLIIPLAEAYGLERAEEMLMKGMDDAARDVAEGRAVAIGEIGRPHFPVSQEIWDASNRVLLHGMELAKENDCPVIIHCESEDDTEAGVDAGALFD
ncbi:MAG: TatD family hydrolase, partial [Candidatus Cryptobacteroides sp.]